MGHGPAPAFGGLCTTKVDGSGMTLGRLFVYPPLLSIPFVTAHAVLADRLLDVRPLVGRAARYLLARTTLSLLTGMPLVGLALSVAVAPPMGTDPLTVPHVAMPPTTRTAVAAPT